MWDHAWPAAPETLGSEPALRRSFAAFATGVCIVTTRSASGKREGLTVSSFNTVSTSPPLVCWSLTRRSASAEAFSGCSHYGVSVLASSQRDLALAFSRRAVDKFADHARDFSEGLAGVPLLRGAAATFECRNTHQYYGGDHLLFVGQVERHTCLDVPVLVFHRSGFAQLTSLSI